MPSWTLILSAALAAGGGETHVERIEHRGLAYDVSYRPHLETRMKTIGSAVGPRPSGERCRWSVEVQVRRIVRREGVAAGHEALLPAVHRIEGSRFGHCKAAQDAIRREQTAKLGNLQERLAGVAARDRLAAIAHIDAAHALAAN